MEPIRWQIGQKEQEEQADLAGLHRISAGANRSDSWVDATVTLLATIIFGLGWAVVELEGADPMQAGYDQSFKSSQASEPVQATWSSGAIDASISAGSVAVGFRSGEFWGAEKEQWSDMMAPRSSKQ